MKLVRLVPEADEVVARWRAVLGGEPLGGIRDLQREVLWTVAHSTDVRQRRRLQHVAARLGEQEPELAELVHQLAALRQVLHAVLTERLATAAADAEHEVNTAIDLLVEACTRSTTERLSRAAFVDPLTGLRNRRALERDLPERLALATRGNRPLTLVVGDLDGLKTINDRDGHAAGDQALRALGAAIDSALRVADAAYRIGGDEFLLVLPDTTAEDAETVITRMSRSAPSFGWGVASLPNDGTDGARLIDLADERLIGSRRSQRRPHGPEAPATSERTSRHRPWHGLAAGALAVSGILGGGLAFAGDGVFGRTPNQNAVRAGGSVPKTTMQEAEVSVGSSRPTVADVSPAEGRMANPGVGAALDGTTTTTTAGLIAALLEDAAIDPAAVSPLTDSEVLIQLPEVADVLPLQPPEPAEFPGELVVRERELGHVPNPRRPLRPPGNRGRN